MKKNSLTTAVIAGIAGVAGFASLANAVDLNPDGLGQVLLYPYYTVEKGQQTYLSVVNTTSRGKAVKVRFLEGYNSREVLDFNLWLSRYDVWTATIFALEDIGVESDGAAILTRDRSCTSPAFTEGEGTVGGAPYVEFRSFGYAGDSGPQTISRTREGHFEIIEMATLTGSTENAITHGSSGTPGGCATVRNLVAANADMSAPSGGLFGGGAIANVGQGTYYSFNADALDGFSASTIFTGTENLFPALSSVNDVGGATATAFVPLGTYVATSVYDATDPRTAIDAVSATLTADSIYNEYTVAPAIGANSDWVVTFPTKRFYVDRLFNAAAPVAPFTEAFASGRSCVEIGISIYDREERTTSGPTSGFSPPPPGAPPSSLCRETNVISFLDVSAAPTESGVLGSKLVTNIRPTVGTDGWVRLDLTPSGEAHALRPSLNGNVFHGLPTTGFWATNLVNENVTAGVMSNYSGVYRHRSSRSCTAGESVCS
ncbi:MAG: hypothetical protein NVV68_16050 [Dokdonella sp.]|jgi:hypothetical protein|nr:hypothetical protein [Dokdonella sp.]